MRAVAETFVKNVPVGICSDETTFLDPGGEKRPVLRNAGWNCD